MVGDNANRDPGIYNFGTDSTCSKNRPPVRKRGADAVAVTNPKVVGRFERRRLPGRELTRRLGPGCSSELIEWTLELRRHR